MKHFLTIFLVFMLVPTFVFAAQRLPRNWHDLYNSDHGWRIICDTPRSNGSLIYLKSAGDKLGPNDVVVRFLYSHRMARLLIAPYEGQCTGGALTIDGQKKFDLVGNIGTCTSVEGDAFATPENSHKKRKPQPIGMFTQGEKLEILLNTKDGRNISTVIPLEGFAEAFTELEAGTKCGGGGGRR